MTFPTIGPAQEWATDAHVARWREMFPTLDVDAECRRALAWVEANPTKRKTARGMPKFLVGWMLRAERDLTVARTPTPAMRLPVHDQTWRDECQHQPKCGTGGIHARRLDLDNYRKRA